MEKLPKYIENKCNRLSKLTANANKLKSEIEKWAADNGIDTCCNEWYTEVIDDCFAVKVICKDSLLDMINNQ